MKNAYPSDVTKEFLCIHNTHTYTIYMRHCKLPGRASFVPASPCHRAQVLVVQTSQCGLHHLRSSAGAGRHALPHGLHGAPVTLAVDHQFLGAIFWGFDERIKKGLNMA